MDTKLGEHVDLVKVVLFYYNDLSLLPELYDIFGGEALIKFLDIFGGTTIDVPPAETIERAIRDVSIYLRIKKSTEENTVSGRMSLFTSGRTGRAAMAAGIS